MHTQSHTSDPKQTGDGVGTIDGESEGVGDRMGVGTVGDGVQSIAVPLPNVPTSEHPDPGTVTLIVSSFGLVRLKGQNIAKIVQVDVGSRVDPHEVSIT